MEQAVPILPADDLRVAKEFYVGRLGFAVRFEVTEDGRTGLLGLERGTISLTIDSPMSGHGREACVSLQVNNADDYYREWRDKVAVKRPPRDETWGKRTFDLIDPFGNTIFVIGPVTRTPGAPEVWLRGPVADFEPLLMPVVHALLQAREDIERAAMEARTEDLWRQAGDAAAAGYHLQHLAGSLDRLLTYARGESLTDDQRTALARESTAGAPASVLVAAACQAIDRALEQVRHTPREELLEQRSVGRAQLPATVLGLLFHAAEHTTRHVGQLITTLKAVTGSDRSGTVG